MTVFRYVNLTPFLLLLFLISVVSGSELPYMQTSARDLRSKGEVTILVFGDAGTGYSGQYRVGKAMTEICNARKCDFALMLGDNIYSNGIEVREGKSAEASFQEIQSQFDSKFEQPYRGFQAIDGFHFWGVLGNHDYRKNSAYSQVMYSQFSELWRMPAYNYDIPYLPDWLQIYGLNTDTDERKNLNGLAVAAARRSLCEPGREDRWKFVFGHHPTHNYGHHEGSDQQESVRSLLEPMFRSCGVHVYFSGHSHHQELLTVDGYEQVIQGAAGKSKGHNRCKNPSAGMEQRYYTQDFGFSIVVVRPEKIQIDFYSVLNTSEKGQDGITPESGEIVLKHSWVAGKDQIGKPASGGKCVTE